MNIFISDLPVNAPEADVKKLFETFGGVSKVYLRTRTGGDNARRYGTIEMFDEAAAQEAISQLDGKEFMGKYISVSLARPKPEKPKKDYKEIKRLRMEARLNPVKPIVLDDSVPEIKEVKEFKKKKVNEPYSGRRGPSEWKKRIGKGKTKAWKKKPGGVRKKFKVDR